MKLLEKGIIGGWPLPAALSLGFVLLVLTDPGFADWAFARHTNLWSWLLRPLLLIPFCLAAWLRSAAGIGWAVFALLTSMVWFPPPDAPDPRVLAFLEMEKALLASGWHLATLAGALAVVVFLVSLAMAFWHRSWRIGLLVAALGALAKLAWSQLMAGQVALLLLPFAVLGFAVLALAVLRFAQRD